MEDKQSFNQVEVCTDRVDQDGPVGKYNLLCNWKDLDFTCSSSIWNQSFFWPYLIIMKNVGNDNMGSECSVNRER